jgi:hypothetical protein
MPYLAADIVTFVLWLVHATGPTEEYGIDIVAAIIAIA